MTKGALPRAMPLIANKRCHFDEGFGQAFSKACAVEAAEASSRSAEREISESAFLF